MNENNEIRIEMIIDEIVLLILIISLFEKTEMEENLAWNFLLLNAWNDANKLTFPSFLPISSLDRCSKNLINS